MIPWHVASILDSKISHSIDRLLVNISGHKTDVQGNCLFAVGMLDLFFHPSNLSANGAFSNISLSCYAKCLGDSVLGEGIPIYSILAQVQLTPAKLNAECKTNLNFLRNPETTRNDSYSAGKCPVMISRASTKTIEWNFLSAFHFQYTAYIDIRLQW